MYSTSSSTDSWSLLESAIYIWRHFLKQRPGKRDVLRGVGGAGLAKEAPDWQRGREPKASAVSLPPQLLPSSPYMYISHFQSHPTFTVNIILSTSYCQHHIVNIILSTSYCQPHLTVGAFNPTCSLQSGLLLPPTAQLNRLQTSLTRWDHISSLCQICFLQCILQCTIIPIIMKDSWSICARNISNWGLSKIWPVAVPASTVSDLASVESPDKQERVGFWSTRNCFATVIQTSALCCEKISTIRRCT